MSSNTPTPPPADSYKRKFEVLQAQLAASNDCGPTARRYTCIQVISSQ